MTTVSSDEGPGEDTRTLVELAERARTGDREALDRLLARTRDRLRRIAKIRLGGELRRALDASDIVQNAYLVAIRKVEDLEIRDEAGIVNWLAQIAENQIRDARRYQEAQKRDHHRTLIAGATEGDWIAQQASPAASPSRAMREAEMKEIYDACLEELSPKHREVLLLRDYADGSWEFVRDELGSPTVGAVQELYRRARLRLTAILSVRLRDHTEA